MKGLFITGTDTDVGKTYIACQIASELNKRNINVIPRKPVETGCKLINNILLPDDANLLLKASQSSSSLDDVCPYRFTQAISPTVAAKLSGESISLKQLSFACTNNISDTDFLLVEGAGGFYSPICDNALNSDLAIELQLPIILVTDDRVGAVNQALLTINAIENSNLSITGILLSSTNNDSFNKLADNTSELSRLTNYPVYKVSHNHTIPVDLIERILR